ncbi:MAG: ornithine cyclodeaminase family protein [Alicyclobacillus sp.]|nr:ornithine cyclodeaminase family protein [Alicyclobacillus sp.]
MPLWLGREDIISCIDERQLILEMRKALQAVSEWNRDGTPKPQRIRADLSSVEGAPTDASAMILVPGIVPGISAYTVKVHAKYPQNTKRGLPAIQGVIQLFDSRNGKLLAIIDSPIATAHRTAAAAVVATDLLARKDSHKVAVIGAGVQGEIQLRYLQYVREISWVSVYDMDADRAEQYVHRRRREGIECEVASSVRDAVEYADIVITATWSRSPILFPGMVRPGTHITTLGADEPGKVEVAEELIRKGRFFCDDREMATQVGALNTFSRPTQFKIGTVGQVLVDGDGRRSDGDITIFGGVGLPFQDLVGAWHVYQRALALDIGQRLS